MIIRCYLPKDRETLKEITAICFEGVAIDHNIEKRYGIIAGMPWQERKKQHIDLDIEANAAGIFVAEENGVVLGYISTRISSDTKIGSIPNLSVLPEYQNQGIGQKLFKAAFDYFNDEGMAYVRIETLDQNKVGQHLYPKLGFQEIARQVHYIMPLVSPDSD